MTLPIYQAGNPQSPTLLLLHPGGALHSVWRPFIRQWLPTFHILAPDLVAEPGRPLSLPALAAEVAALLRQQTGKPAYVVGSSMGANVALHLALNAPDCVAALVLDSAQVGTAGPPSLRSRALLVSAKIIFHLMPHRTFMAGLLNQYKEQYDPADRAAISAEIEQVGRMGYLAHIVAHQDHFVGDRLAYIRVPTLILAGETDSLTRTKEPEKLQAGIPAAECHILPGADHVTFAAQPDLFYQLTTDFLQRQLSRTTQP